MTTIGDDLIRELERKIEELKARFPAHSIPPALMAKLDELEAQLILAIKRRDEPPNLEHSQDV